MALMYCGCGSCPEIPTLPPYYNLGRPRVDVNKFLFTSMQTQEAELQPSASTEAIQSWLNNSPQQSRACQQPKLTRQPLQLPGQRLVPSKSLPRLSVCSVSSEESWHRPQVRILHDPPIARTQVERHNSFTRSIDEAFQGPLYKEVVYSSVNMNNGLALTEKDLKTKSRGDIPTPTATKPGKDIMALGSPSSVKIFPATKQPQRPNPSREEPALVPKVDIVRRSPIGSSASSSREEIYQPTRVTRIAKLDSSSCPMCRQEALQAGQPKKNVHARTFVSEYQKRGPQTSTPIQRGSHNQMDRCSPQCLANLKTVHFSPVVLSPIIPGSPPGYRPPPVGSCSKPDFSEFSESRTPQDQQKESTCATSLNCGKDSLYEGQSTIGESFTDPTLLPDDSLLRQYLTLEVDRYGHILHFPSLFN